MNGNVLRNIFGALCFCLAVSYAQAQEAGLEESVRAVVGETDIESLDPEVVESMYELSRNPVRLNSAGVSQLEATGLFTPFQLAALTDYIARHGQVLSLTELSLIDGFSAERVDAIAPFISIGEAFPASASFRQRRTFSGELALRGGVKYGIADHSVKSSYGFRSRLKWADKIVLTLSGSEPYDSLRAWPTVYTGNLTWQHRLGKVVAGDFNARFGQGMCLWNTASFSSLTAPSSFMKRASGISPSYSFTGTSALTGVAADFAFGRWKATALAAVIPLRKYFARPERLTLFPAVNLCRYGRYGHVSATHCMSFSDFLSQDYRIPQMMSSIDGSVCFDGVNLFGEAVFDWVSGIPSALTGVEYAVGDGIVTAALIKYSPSSNEHMAALAGEVVRKCHRFMFSAEGKYHPVSKSKDSRESFQVKGQFDWQWKPDFPVEVKLKISERFRTWGTVSRTQMRTDFRYSGETWYAALRLDALYGVGFACCGYAEGGYASGSLSVNVRCGMFRVDDWDDRIYVYERDMPGYFSVPALYGRGFWTSAYLSWKYAGWGTLYLRGIYKNPGNAEVKVQCVLHF